MIPISQITIMSAITWIKVTENSLPEYRQRIMFYSPIKLTKIGEMTYLCQSKEEIEWFLETITHYTKPVNKPMENDNGN